MNDAKLIERGVRAKAVLENDMYQEGFAACRAAIIALIEKTPLSDTQTAEDLRRCLKLLRDVRTNLEIFMNLGRGAEFRLIQDEEKRKNPLKGFFR